MDGIAIRCGYSLSSLFLCRRERAAIFQSATSFDVQFFKVGMFDYSPRKKYSQTQPSSDGAPAMTLPLPFSQRKMEQLSFAPGASLDEIHAKSADATQPSVCRDYAKRKGLKLSLPRIALAQASALPCEMTDSLNSTEEQASALPREMTDSLNSTEEHPGASLIRDIWRNRQAALIQRKWKRFIGSRKQVVATMLDILPLMGDKVADEGDFSSLMDEGRIVIQANGKVDDPLAKHSAIYHGYLKHELVLHETDNPGGSKYGISRDVANFLNDKTEDGGYRAGQRSFIDITFPNSDVTNHLIKKGRMFALREEYSAHFEQAREQAKQHLQNSPYSYGVHYNCHVFVLHFLQNLRDLSP